MTNRIEPERPRRLGRSRAYTAGDLPERLRHWHAPRINRWERLHVTAGTLGIACLEAAGVMSAVLVAGDKRWFAPGMRWRVTDMNADSRFELEVHADWKGQAEAPQQLRTELLTEARRMTASDVRAFDALVHSLPAGERRIVEGRFDMGELTGALFDTRTLSWHPLDCSAGYFTALIARSRQPFDLAAYLGRDHAVIEAALGGALSGDAESDRWLRATLERHLHIEEDLLFPAYIEVGGLEAWVDGLKREHGYLRQYLNELDQPGSRRKFLRLLDGHDEKEERVVYPDILARLGARAEAVLMAAMGSPVRHSNSERT